MILRIALLVACFVPFAAQAEERVKQATYRQALTDAEVAAQSERIYHIVRTRGANASSVAMLLQLSRDLPDDASAKLFSRLAGEWHFAGEIDLASDCRRTLLEKFPDSPEAKAAFLKLIQTYSSGEVAHAHRLTAAIKTSADEQPANRQMLAYASMFAVQNLKTNKASLQSPALDWHRGTIQRLLGREKAAIGLHTALKRRSPEDLWRKRVDFEEWLLEDREGEPLLPTVACGFAEERPYLDGVLEESIWKRSNTTRSQAVEVRYAYDAEYFYLAMKVKREQKLDGRPDDQPRKRDADLTKFDRVRILLDRDRDYATAYELTVDHRGWTSDACWGDVTWNPEWFVAAHQGAEHWHIEAAVSWASLVEKPPAAGDAWAVRYERLLPGELTPAKPRAADFGVLLFE